MSIKHIARSEVNNKPIEYQLKIDILLKININPYRSIIKNIII